MMSDVTGLRMLQKLGGYAVGAVAGALVTDPSGASMPLQALCAILATSLAVDLGASAAESALQDAPDRLERIETWLAELIRKHGQVAVAVTAIANGIESHSGVDPKQAEWLTTMFAASEAQLNEIAKSNVRIESLLLYVSAKLATDIGETQQGIQDIKGMLARRAVDDLSDEAIAARTVDAAENAELRREQLRACLDTLDLARARGLSARCWRWVRKQQPFAMAHRARLIDVILDEHIARMLQAGAEERSEALRELRDISGHLSSLLESLDEADRLRFSSMVAFATSLCDGADAGLRMLEGRTDPFAIRRRMAILCNANRYAEATDLIRGRDRDLVWAERGLLAFAGNGEIAEAKALTEWTLQRIARQQHSRIRCLFAQAIVERLQQNGVDGPKIIESDRPSLLQAREVLGPALEETLAGTGEPSRIDAEVLRYELHMRILLDDGQQIGPVAARMERVSPFDLILAELARRDWIQPGPHWSQRVRAELPRSFERDLTAAWLDGRHADRHAASLEATLRLVPEATSEDQKEHVRALLMQLAQHADPQGLSSVEQVLKTLSEPDSRHAQLWKASRLISKGDLQQAIETLAPLHDESDPLWLQLQGQALLKQGKSSEAIVELTKAAMLVGGVAILRNAAGIALAHEHWVQAESLLTRLVKLVDADLATGANLATVWHLMGRNLDAANRFAELARQYPDRGAFDTQAAECFVLAGRPEEAVGLLENVCSKDEVSTVSLIQLGQLYVDRGDAAKAYALMDRFRPQRWKDHQFVMGYWTVAIAAEQELKAQEALEQLFALQRDSQAPRDLLISKTLEDMIDMAKVHAEAEKERADMLINARMPWLAIEEVRRNPAMQAWTQRTWPHAFVFENRVGLADAVVYATHGFTVVETSRHGSDLVQIEAPTQPGPVVADLTALITLHRLGLLPMVARQCGQIHIPEAYLFKMFSDHSRLRPHQPSTRSLLSRLHSLHAQSKIAVAHDASKLESMPIVDEYYTDTPPLRVHHLADLVNALKTEGAISEPEMKRLNMNARRAPVASAINPPILLGAPLRVALSTLSTIYVAGLLDRIADKFLLHLSPQDYGLVSAQSAAFAHLEGIRQEHVALWRFLRDDPSIVKHPPAPRDDKDFVGDIALASGNLAIAMGVPLLADDRVLQALVLTERAVADAACGSLDMVGSMKTAGLVDAEAHADVMLRLMEWRYRFIIPTADVLMIWAKRSQTNSPGPELQAAARYLHACLRDPGLLAGMERCTPATTLALRFRQAVEHELGEFLGRLWFDATILDQNVTDLTAWTLTNMLPSPPVSMEPGIRAIAELWHPIFLSSFLIQVATARDTKRASEALRVFAGLAEVPHDELAHRAVEVIDGLARF